LKARENYDIEIKGNPIAMLKAIQEHTMSYQENRYNAKIMVDTLRNLLYMKQRDDEDLADIPEGSRPLATSMRLSKVRR
jgi:hypothetical protein